MTKIERKPKSKTKPMVRTMVPVAEVQDLARRAACSLISAAAVLAIDMRNGKQVLRSEDIRAHAEAAKLFADAACAAITVAQIAHSGGM